MSTATTEKGGTALCGSPRAADIPRLLYQAVTDPISSMQVVAQRYGGAVSVPLSRSRAFLVLSHPAHAEHVLVSHNDHYETAFTYRPLQEWIGLGLITSDGELWERQRRLIQPLFSHRRVTALAPHMIAATTRMVEQWATQAEGTVIDVGEAMSGLTLDIVGRTLLGADLTGEARRASEAVGVLQDAASSIVKNPLTWVSPRAAARMTPGLRRWTRSMRTLEELIDATIAERMAAPSSAAAPHDLLDALVGARDEQGQGIERRQIRDEIITFFMAGHETSAMALTWTLYLLSTAPSVRERLEAEVDAVLSGRTPGAADVESLPWTKAVLSESMRLYPPVWTIERDCVVPDDVCGIPVRKGSTVAVPPYLVHRHPDVWENPEGFDPERFIGARAAGRHRYAWIPFGGGRRGCIGNVFALMEMVIALVMISQRHRLDLVPGFDPRPKVTVTLRPRQPLLMTVHHRSS
jgi:cytochrome P450